MTYLVTAGRLAGLAVPGMPIHESYAGATFWVDSNGGSDLGTGRGTFNLPYATVNYAIGRCSADSGDEVHIKPGHNEGGTAADLFDFTIAGVSVIGHGHGDSRPTFDYDATGTTIGISAANAYLENVILRASVNIVTTAFIVDGTYAHLHNVEFKDELIGTDEFVDCITTTGVDNSEDGLTVTSSKYLTTSAGVNSFIVLENANRFITVMGNIVSVATAAGSGQNFIRQGTAGDVQTMITLVGNYYSGQGTGHDTGDAVLLGGTGTHTGIATWNRMGTLDTAGGKLIADGNNILKAENYQTSDADAGGALWPIATVHGS